MYKTGINFTKKTMNAKESAFHLEKVAYQNIKLAHTRSFEQPENIFAANAFIKAIDNYQKIVAEHERMGL